MKNIQSPFGNYTTEVFDEIQSDFIIKRYKKELNIDVSKMFDEISKVQVIKCHKTGYKFYYPYSMAGDANFYESLNKGKLYHSKWKHEFQKAYDIALKLGSEAKVLDIGCGFGDFLMKLKSILTSFLIKKPIFLRNLINSEMPLSSKKVYRFEDIEVDLTRDCRLSTGIFGLTDASSPRFYQLSFP